MGRSLFFAVSCFSLVYFSLELGQLDCLCFLLCFLNRRDGDFGLVVLSVILAVLCLTGKLRCELLNWMLLTLGAVGSRNFNMCESSTPCMAHNTVATLSSHRKFLKSQLFPEPSYSSSFSPPVSSHPLSPLMFISLFTLSIALHSWLVIALVLGSLEM